MIGKTLGDAVDPLQTFGDCLRRDGDLSRDPVTIYRAEAIESGLTSCAELIGDPVQGNLDQEAQVSTLRSLFGSPRPSLEPSLHGTHPSEILTNPKIAIVDDQPISDAELARAAQAGVTLLHTGHRWVRIDADDLRRKRQRLTELQADTDPADTPARLLIEGAVLHLQADLDWLERCQEEFV